MTGLKFALLALVVFASAPATAAKLDDVRKQTHYSMDLTGWLDVNEVGVVTDHGFDQDAAKLPSTVVALVAHASSKWRFAANVEGSPVAVRAPMRLRVEAKRSEGGNISGAHIAGARFGEVPEQERVVFAKQQGKTTVYSWDGKQSGVSGNVYVVVRVGRDGKPMQAVAQRVDLTFVDGESRMERWRRVLGELGVRSAKNWRFIPPSAGPEALRSDWTVRVPVSFVADGGKPPAAGTWELYIPGPTQVIPWDVGTDVPTVGDGRVVPDEVASSGSALQLLTPLDEKPN